MTLSRHWVNVLGHRRRVAVLSLCDGAAGIGLRLSFSPSGGWTAFASLHLPGGVVFVDEKITRGRAREAVSAATNPASAG